MKHEGVMSMRDISPVVRGVFSALLTMQDRYFYAGKPPHGETEHYQSPVGPGAACYKDDVSSFRITGADPGFPQEYARDVPAHVIINYRRSLLQGIEMVFPAQAVSAYLNDRLKEPDFNKGPVSIDRFFLHDFPRMLSEPPKGKIDNPFRFSLEHDIRHDFYSSGLSHVRHDRKNFTNGDLYDFYKYSLEQPELICSFLFWQEHMANYCSELRWLIAEYCDVGTHAGTDAVEERFPVNHLIRLFESSVIMSNIPQYLGAYVLAARDGEEIESQDFSRGIVSAMRAGVFRRRYQTAFGEKQIICPFMTAISDFMAAGPSKDIDGESGTAISRCYAKIRTERHLPKISVICGQIREIIRSTLAESEASVIARIEGASKEEKGFQCQLHA